MNLYLVQWEEFDGNEHTILMATYALTERNAREKIVEQMKRIDAYFDSEEITQVDIEEIKEVDGYLVKLEAK